MNEPREDLYELLALRSTEGLAEADSGRALALLQDCPEIDPEGFERAAAAVHLALLGAIEPLPPSVEGKLIEAGRRYVATEMSQEPSLPVARRRALAHLERGWLAAAAILVLAVIGWWPRVKPPRDRPVAQAAIPAPPAEALLAEPDALRLPWTPTGDPTAAGATGEVVWSTTSQAGFMRFSGLEANDPSVYQYQLWIFDRNRDERYPVDGGVFDVPPGREETVVPIDARIEVGEPYLFAVTVEPPGGVVVSSRERIALTAQPS